jgi:hypothetical protein
MTEEQLLSTSVETPVKPAKNPISPLVSRRNPPSDFNKEVEYDIKREDSLTVSEIFGPTWQGEGPTLGRLCTFIRLGACNLTCGANGGWKCDANYTWDWTGITGTKFDPKVELRKMTSTQIIEEVRRHAPKTWDNQAYHTDPMSKATSLTYLPNCLTQATL